MREHRDFCILSEQLLQIVLKLVRLPLGERQVIVVSHVFTLPKLLKSLPLLLDAQPLGHRISQQGRLGSFSFYLTTCLSLQFRGIRT